MSLNNEMNTEIVNAEIINTEIMPITMAELLEQDFHNDDEAEFLQAVLQIQMEIENVILSDNPEEFLLPTEEEDLSPAMILIEKLEELKSFRFGDRTLARMERTIRNVNQVKRSFLTESEKANHPEYTKCPECLRHFTKSYLGHHLGTAVCLKVKTAHNLRPAGTDKKKVSDKIYNACLDLEDLYSRAVAYKKNIEPELQEEEYEENTATICQGCGKETDYEIDIGCVCEECNDKQTEEDNQICIGCEKPAEYYIDNNYICGECNSKRNDEHIWDEYGNEHIGHLLRFRGNTQVLYKVKLWEGEGEYIGLYEDNEGERYWKTEGEGETYYDEAIESGDWTGVQLVRVSKYSDDESVIGDWEEEYTNDKICHNCEHYDINTIDYYGELVCSRCFTKEYKEYLDQKRKQKEEEEH